MGNIIKIGIAAALSYSVAFSNGFGTATVNTTPDLRTGSDGKQYEYVICGALEGGSYIDAARNLVDIIGFNPRTKQYFGRAETTDGVKQNFQLMSQGVCNVLIAQGDYLAYMKGTSPQFFKGKTVYSTDRTENTMLIQRNGDDEDDIQGNNAKIHVGLRNSGGAASYTNIVSLDGGYKSKNVQYGEITVDTLPMLLDELASKKLDTIIITMHLDAEDNFITRAVKRNEDVYFSDLDDYSLNNSFDYGDGKVDTYKFQKTVVDYSGWDTKAWTLESKVSIIVDTQKMSSKQKSAISKAIRENRDTLFQKNSTYHGTGARQTAPAAQSAHPQQKVVQMMPHEQYHDGEEPYGEPEYVYESGYDERGYAPSHPQYTPAAAETGHSTATVVAAGLGGALLGNMLSNSGSNNQATHSTTTNNRTTIIREQAPTPSRDYAKERAQKKKIANLKKKRKADARKAKLKKKKALQKKKRKKKKRKHRKKR